jgi:hypothetical protein
MARKRTGISNRRRHGRSTYSTQHKAAKADRYGSWTGGRQERSDTIGGHACTWPLNSRVITVGK